MLRWALIPAVITSICAGASAQVRVDVRVSPARIHLGEEATLHVDVSGVRQTEPPTISIPGIDVTYIGGSGHSNTNLTIINGQMQRIENFGFVMQYRLRPTQTGDITILPIEIEHDGHVYRSRPALLRVAKLPDQEYVILEQEVAPAAVYVEQTVKARLRVYLKKLKLKGSFASVDPIFPRSIPHLTIPWFASLKDWKTGDPNDFAKRLIRDVGEPGFAINNYVRREFFDQWPIPFKLPRTSVERRCKDGKRRPYFCYTLEKEFRPASPGAYDIPAVMFTGTIPVALDSFGRASRQEKIIASSQSATVTVRPIPTEGRPADFSGAIGHYKFEVDAIPKVAKVGDPIDLILSITGDGILEKILPPDLSKQTALMKYFRVHTDAPVPKTTGSTKAFRYTVRAKGENVDAIPAISFSYFDVDAGEFKTISSKPVAVNISPTAELSLSEVVETAGARARSRLGREREKGLLANFTGESLLANQEFEWGLSAGLLAALLVPPVVCVASLLAHRRAMKLRTDSALLRSRAAKRDALARLNGLGKRSEIQTPEFCGELSKAVTAYLADKLNLPCEGLTATDIEQQLAERNIGHPLADSANELIMQCDSGRFGGSATEHDRTEMIRKAREIVILLEKEL